jgi:DNA repair exonuclease SbcCD ATPase subunit
MDNPETSLIIASTRQLPAFEFNVSAKESKEVALRNAALIAKVTDRDSKIIAVRAQQGLKKVISDIEKARKELKEPLLNAGRQLDNLCATETLELDKEFGRVSNAVKEFDDAERRRVLEEERLQRLELERIEAEKQAELKRIADKQAAREAESKRIQDAIDSKLREAKETAERKAREEREAAEKLAREATNKKQREAAEKARTEAEKRAEIACIEAERQKALAEAEKARQDAAMSAQRAKSEAQAAAIEEKAGDAAYCAAKPIAITTVAGSRQLSNWVITVTQPFVLAKYRPDLVDIKPRLADIKNALNNGETIQGITAVRETTSGVRLPPERKAIEV